MIGLGEAHGCPTVALLTAMDRPLGRACGHSLEVEEALEGLQGRGPDDLMEVTYALGVEMLLLVGAAKDRADARRRLEESVSSGRALETFGSIIEAQGGNRAVVDDPAILPQAGAVEVYRAPRGGVVAAVEPRRIGRGILELGGGRVRIEDRIDPAVGFVITVKPGRHGAVGRPDRLGLRPRRRGRGGRTDRPGRGDRHRGRGTADAAHHPPHHRPRRRAAGGHALSMPRDRWSGVRDLPRRGAARRGWCSGWCASGAIRVPGCTARTTSIARSSRRPSARCASWSGGRCRMTSGRATTGGRAPGGRGRPPGSDRRDGDDGHERRRAG